MNISIRLLSFFRTRRINCAAEAAVLIAVLNWFGAALSAQQTASIAGIWEGRIQTGPQSLRIVVRFEAAPDGGWKGRLDSPDQGARGLPLEGVSIEGARVRFALTSAGGRFEGEMDTGGTTIKGQWSQAGISLPLELKKVEAPSRPNRPQEPKPPFPYRVEKVRIPTDEEGVVLAGTLTVPPGGGRRAAVLLVTGSGAQDRDETVFDHKPFLVLADYLTRSDMVVLRIDDRGTGESGGSLRQMTTEDIARDAARCFEFLRNRPEVDPARTGIIGHSEGALIAAMLAARNSGVRFVVLLAGTGAPGAQVLVEQAAAISRASGAPPDVLEWERNLQRALVEIAASQVGETEAAKSMDTAIAEAMKNLPAALGSRTGAIQESIRRGREALLTPWVRTFLRTDPASYLEKIRCPLLAVYGEKDLQVLPSYNLPRLAEALERGGNPGYAILKLSGLNHLLQTAATGLPAEYSRIEETISPRALAALGDWLKLNILTGR